ncbi:MAG: molecular chaperone DnaJ [Planctomycetota bacterium]|nr:molecular chaperone DnaJ [Planctomycetota bacterium]
MKGMPVAAAKRDYYEVLGVTRTSDAEEIKRAYRRQAMKFHPDRANGDKVEAETRFKECSEAYEVLSDSAKRQRYDKHGHEGVSSAHDFSHMDVTDIFSMFDDIFGGALGGGAAGRGRGRQQTRGYDLETRVDLTLFEVLTGTEKTIDFEKQDRCENCGGTGAKAGSSPIVCVQCGGQGRVAQQGFGGMFRMVVSCPNCQGRGTVIRDHCPTCGGKGRQLRKRTVVVKIPAGVHDGQAVRVTGEGEAGETGAPSGDLHVYIHVKEHPVFTRHNNDLVCQVPVTFSEAALGATIDVPTLRGTEALEIPSGTQHGEMFKLKGKGLPDVRSYRSGDELVQIVIEVPKRLTEKQKQLLREFAASDEARMKQQRKGFLDKLKELIKGEDSKTG